MLALTILGAIGGCSPRPSPDDRGAVYRGIQRDVFDASCAIKGCHVGHQSETGLDLTAEQSYRSLVNIRSVQIADLMRIAPGDPDRSYLIRKLEGRQIVGERMPQGHASLPPETIARIREWIRDGAPGPEAR